MLELKAASQGKVVIMRQEQLEGIITVLNAIGSEASPELKQSIQKIKQDIRQKKILSRAGIKINRWTMFLICFFIYTSRVTCNSLWGSEKDHVKKSLRTEMDKREK